jgi:hypothetical protein
MEKVNMDKLLEGALDFIPGLISGSSANFFGSPLDPPWGNNDEVDRYAPISDEDGTRIGDNDQKDSGIIRRPDMTWGPPEYDDQTDIIRAPANVAEPAIRKRNTMEPPPRLSEGYQEGADRRNRSRSGVRDASRSALRDRLLNDEIEKSRQDDFLRNRRDREQKWNETKEANDIPMAPVPRGVLLPELDDDFDINDDPNETDEERDSRRARSRWISRGQAAGIAAIGGISGAEIYNSWKERSKWVLKNGGTIQGRMYPQPPSIPNAGLPGDLIPDIPIPENGIIPLVPNYQRAVFVQNVDPHAMDCSC